MKWHWHYRGNDFREPLLCLQSNYASSNVHAETICKYYNDLLLDILCQWITTGLCVIRFSRLYVCHEDHNLKRLTTAMYSQSHTSHWNWLKWESVCLKLEQISNNLFLITVSFSDKQNKNILKKYKSLCHIYSVLFVFPQPKQSWSSRKNSLLTCRGCKFSDCVNRAKSLVHFIIVSYWLWLLWVCVH